jgi:ATP-binding cassette, subfamily B, bacterial HlyB/CyaB
VGETEQIKAQSDSMTPEINPGSQDPGLYVLVSLLHMNGVGADRDQIQHRFGGVPIGIPEMLRCAKDFEFKARDRLVSWERLATTPLPAIAARRDGGFLLLVKAGSEKVLVQSPYAQRPEIMNKAEFEAACDGRVVLMTRRVGLIDLARRFDITWFVNAIHKYRHQLSVVLAAFWRPHRIGCASSQ